jgi:hypothetical protein
MKKPFVYFLTLPVFILMVGLACSLSGGPTPPREVKTSPELARSVDSSLQTAQPNPTTGMIRFTVTESQMTSYVVYNLRQDFEPILKNPVIVFQPDRIELYGTIQGDSITANGRVVMSVNINGQGEPSVKIVEANFGPFPVPTGLLDNLSTAIDRSLTDAVSNNNTGYQLDSILITSGSATITIRKK